MKKHRPVKHAHRKAMIRERLAKGKFSKAHLPKDKNCWRIQCLECWATGTRYCP